MPTPADDDNTTTEFKALVAANNLPWRTPPSDSQANAPWSLMACGAASVLAEHIPVPYETPGGEVRCRCSCGVSGTDIDTPARWALHVCTLLFAPRL